jgi:hypothetical protein
VSGRPVGSAGQQGPQRFDVPAGPAALKAFAVAPAVLRVVGQEHVVLGAAARAVLDQVERPAERGVELCDRVAVLDVADADDDAAGRLGSGPGSGVVAATARPISLKSSLTDQGDYGDGYAGERGRGPARGEQGHRRGGPRRG